ncbi:Coenzyme PQQ synthesis protein D (PqqD) [Marinitoga hydrogenitolerans DSM 16785]|uniref:Coenzyme PQQ synthesis protein D (PqqD) n=1 Tax=Marinitoga hydrogenitolerans (strain DSM 16785 / JCM 12826 / AT1271) TaxID=1122195 RepID=A0A1M5A1V1_MARH1|nr:PqqD family protein [Marinitoga hydrogenitolerans]SHF24087.1 Coenzyme PQQ synthesis protein D (PqqD) [Marinitoga hydrogenitolerans DSM 16785]
MKLKDGLIYREEDSVIFDTEKGKLIELNESANEIIKRLNNKTKRQIIEELKCLYPDSLEEEIEKFFEEFISDARKEGIIYE